MTNMAVIGCGYWGPNLVRNFSALPDCKVKTVCDADPSRLSHMKHLYPHVSTCNDPASVINDPSIDAVAIATPVRTHYNLAEKVLQAGKHALIEKPMAASVQECNGLVSLADKLKLTLMVGHTFLYSPQVHAIKDIVDSGELGKILYVSSRRLNLGLFQKDINVAWDLAPHDIAIVLYVLGEMPQCVSCQGKAHITDGIEDVTNMTLHFPSGVFAMIQSSWLDPSKTREVTFVGTKKMLVYDDIEQTEKIKVYDKRVEVPPHYDTFEQFKYSYHYGDVYSPHIKQAEPLRTECQHFVECIQQGIRPLSDGHNGLMVVRVLEAASNSLKNSGGHTQL